MTVTVANVDINSDTFLSWANKTSQLANTMSTKVVTVGGSSYSTTGNAHIIGSMQANAFYAETGLYGGTIASGNSLIVQSNAVFNSNAVLSNTSTYTIFGSTDNIRMTGSNTTHRSLSVDSSNNTPYYEQVISVGTTGSNVATGNAIISGTFGANTLHANKIGGGNNTVLSTANVFTNASFTNSVHFSTNTFLGSYGEATVLYVNTLRGGTSSSPGLITINTTANLTSNAMFSGSRVTSTANLVANNVYIKALYGGNVTSIAALNVPTAINITNTATFSSILNLGNFQDARISSSGASADYDGKVLSFYANGQFKPISITFSDISGLPTVTPANNDMLVYNASTSEWNATRVLNVSQISIDSDGAGSNIDADQLDGQEGSYYSGLATNAYTNATSYAATIAGTAYSNAITIANTYSNATNILTKLSTVDGAGSGLDADTVDGVQLSTIRTEITGNSATAYTNATSYAATIAGTAYSNATSYAATIAGTAYSNAVSTAASDASSKAATAYSNATSYAASIAGTAYSNAVSQATSKAATAYANAIAIAAAYSSAANTLSKLLTVDGATSGLDADKLDGVQLSTIRTEISSNASTAYTNAYNSAISYSSNASKLSSGTVPAARLSGSYTINISGTATSATNADTVDSLHAASFIRSDAADDVAAHTEWQDGYEVRLGNSADMALFHSANNSEIKHNNASGSLYINKYDSGGNIVFKHGNIDRVYLNGSGLYATGDVVAYYSSDERLKTNIKPISDALNKVNQIRGVEFDWTDEFLEQQNNPIDNFNIKHDVGVIAQEIEKVLPEVVTERENGYKAVKYDRIVSLLIEAIKELSKEVEELKKNRE